jgi:DNA-binding PadR family transcriptional regulator
MHCTTKQVRTLIKQILLKSSLPISETDVLIQIQDKGYHNVKESDLTDYLKFAHANGILRQVPIPRRDEKGWELTESGRKQLAREQQSKNLPTSPPAPPVRPPSPAPPPARPPRPTPERPTAPGPIGSKLWRWQAEALDTWERATRE